MNVQQRAKLLQSIDRRRSISVTEVSDLFDMSIPTARKYLKFLESEGLITFKRGLALKKTHYWESFLGWQLESLPDEKNRIAQKAAEYIDDNDAVFIGGGSTVLGIVDYLAQKQGITVVTNSSYIINKAIHYPQIELICVGGKWSYETSSFDGASMSMDFYPDKAFIGAMALDADRGITQTVRLENHIEFSMFKKSRQGFILADHTKFGVSYAWCGMPAIDIQNIITDKKTEYSELFANIIYA